MKICNICNICKISKSSSEFYKDNSAKDGLQTRCNECYRTWRKSYYIKNKENISTKRKQHYLDNRDKCNQQSKDYYQANREVTLERNREHYRNNKIYYQLKTYKRRGFIKQATPRWADIEAISHIYTKCAELSESTGIKYEVDHIIPLRGKNVCGLHLESNLQIIPYYENRSKYNKFESI